MKTVVSLLKKNKLFFGLMFLFLVYFALAYKNPFNEKSLVPNLEIYPDSFFYAYPSWNLVNGNSFKMEIDGMTFKNIVPPSYGIFLIPFFIVFNDIRSFYFANFVLAIISIVFFFLIVKKIFKNNLTTFILIGILVTSYYFYTLPQFIMAENITLPVFLMLFWMLLQPISTGNIIKFSTLNVVFILIKMSNLPIFIILAFLYFLKVLKEKDRLSLIKFIAVSLIAYGLLLLEIVISGMFKTGGQVASGSAFSFNYFKDNFDFYIKAITGYSRQFIWMQERFITKDLVILSGLGVILALFKNKGRQLIFLILSLLLSLILFMSCFYYGDVRYINLVYPLLLIPIGFVIEKINNKKLLIIFLIIFGIWNLGLVSIKSDFEPRIITLKKQVGLNFRHAEQPWNYLAVKSFNNYFKDKKENVYLATFLPVFYVDYFKNENYKYLPISKTKAFYGYFDRVCPTGINDCYQKILDQSGEIYISNYYLSSEPTIWAQEWDKINKDFTLTKVDDGYLGECKIYKLESKVGDL